MSRKFSINTYNLKAIALFLVCYILALVFDNAGIPAAGSALLLVSAVVSYILFVKEGRNFADLRALLCFSWEAGLGLSLLKLSKLHTEWTMVSKICFAFFIVMFLLGSAAEGKGKETKDIKDRKKVISISEKLIVITAAVTFAAFAAEVIILGYVPAFSKEPHAYSYFHVTGIHYFTISAVMTHALTAVWFLNLKKEGVKPPRMIKALILICNIVSLTQTVLCISKLQLFFVVGIPAVIFIAGYRVKSFKKLPWKRIIIVFSAMLILGIASVVAFTKLRHYEPGYLQEVFEFYEPDTPVAIQYPYMYIANNYANFNYLTEALPEYTYGIKQAFPVFALTGLKFVFPQVSSYMVYVVKEEINTLTIIYDAYYDFGVAGVGLLGLLLGLLASFLKRRISFTKNPAWLILYGQVALYFSLSFFSTWFSIAASWFWFAVTLIYGIVWRRTDDKT